MRIEIERDIETALIERLRYSIDIPHTCENLQLHVKPSIARLRFSINRRAVFEDIEFFFRFSGMLHVNTLLILKGFKIMRDFLAKRQTDAFAAVIEADGGFKTASKSV